MSATNKQFSIAVHLMATLGYMAGEEITSNQIAFSINTSPSFVRRTLSKLSKAGLVRTTTGKSGFCMLARPANKITLLDIYKAVGAPKIFSIHEYPVQKICKVSCNIKSSMETIVSKVKKSLEKALADISLAKIVSEIKGKR